MSIFENQGKLYSTKTAASYKGSFNLHPEIVKLIKLAESGKDPLLQPWDMPFEAWWGIVVMAGSCALIWNYVNDTTSAKLLFTILVFLCVGPAVADMNRSHVTNPLWIPHARFHLCWQIATNTFLSLFAGVNYLYYDASFWFLFFSTGCIFGGFWAAAFMTPLVGSWFADANGIAPFPFPSLSGGKAIMIDTNVFLFPMMTLFYGLSLYLKLEEDKKNNTP